MAFSNKSFLIIDDFQGMRGMMRDILRNCGANVRSIELAANGDEAIRLLRRDKFDVVLCDFNLGSGKNGQQILEEAKHSELISPACAWIIITAEKTTDVIAGAAEYQPDAFLIKPITEATLRMRLGRIWAKKEAFTAIHAALARRDHAEAIRLCNQGVATDKANAADLQRLKCQLLFNAGDLEQARSGYAEVLAERDTPWAKLGMARILFQDKDYAGAKKLLEETIADNRTFLEAYDWLAKTLQAMGDIEAAELVLERAARLSPNSVLRQKSLGDMAYKLGKLDQAERAFRKSVSLGEHSVLKTPDAYFGLAKTCSAKQSPIEAIRVLGNLNKAFDSEDIRLRSLAVEGQVHHQSGNLAMASQTAAELNERMAASGMHPDSETTLEVARLLLATGDHDQAMTLLQDEIRNRPDDTELMAEVQQVFEVAGMAEEGEKIVATSRQEATDMMNQGVLLARDGQLDEAVIWMRNAREAMPRNVRVLFNFVQVILTRLQQAGVDQELVAEARGCLEAASQLVPGDRRLAQMTARLDTLAG